MLACAEECGGQRYVASAIVACSQKENYEDVVKTLAALGTTWLTHLLFPCQFYDIAVNRKNPWLDRAGVMKPNLIQIKNLLN